MIDHGRLAGVGLRHVFLRDMLLTARIGIYPHEQDQPQRVRINVDVAVREQPTAVGMTRGGVGRDDLSRVLDYERLAQSVRTIVADGHVQLVETLAERLAEMCLRDNRVEIARVCVEKLDVFSDMAGAGVEVERRR